MVELRARLVATDSSGNLAPAQVELGHERVTLGRAAGNGVVLQDNEVSKRHAEVLVEDGAHVLRDLGSSNGCFVNGRKVHKHRLAPGDLVELGGCRFTYEPSGGASARVTILPTSPIDKTQVLASSDLAIAELGKNRNEGQAAILYERVRTAFDALQQLIETTDIQLLCHRILDVVFRLVRAETGAVLLFDAAHNLVPWSTRTAGGDSEHLVISRTIVDQVLRDRVGVLASDALRDSRWSSAHSVVLSGVRSLMAVPLVNKERIYGMLHVGNSSETGAFTQGDLELLTGIATGAGVALSNAFMAHQLAEELRTRESLGRFLSPVLVDQVMQRRIDLQRSGQEREVTVMFADIRGFTSLTERSRAVDVVTLLNEYFDQMVEVVFEHHGLLDKFIGDALMAVWGTPVKQQDDAARAIAAARRMQEAL
ncbi:MAG: adenylate/guanylate cyclase domain-containing protein, partial [Myxococcota bacterium]